MGMEHVTEKAAFEIKGFERAIGEVLVSDVQQIANTQKRVIALITSAHSKDGKPALPYLADFEHCQQALTIFCKAKGLQSAQYALRTYAACMRAVFGCVPVSMTAESMRKREERRDEVQQAVYVNALKDALAEHKPDYWAESLAVAAAKGIKDKREAAPANPAGRAELEFKAALEHAAQSMGSMAVIQALETIGATLSGDKLTADAAKTLAGLTASLRASLKLHEAAPSSDPANKPKLGAALADLANATKDGTND